MSDLKSHIKGQVTFVRYHDGNLWYKCEDGYEFPVPTLDCNSAIFLASDKAITFMRWIRIHMSLKDKGNG